MKKKLMALGLVLIFLLSITACGEGSSESGSSSSNSTIAFEPLLVVDNDECSIEITGFDSKKLSLSVSLENKSEEITYMYGVDDAAVNGVQITTFFSKEVSPGKIANGSIDLYDSTLKNIGVTDYTDIELNFHVRDSNDWTADYIVNETVHVYPYGNEMATVYTREPESTDQVLVDNDKVAAVVTDYDEDGFWGYTVNLYLVNRTDTVAMFSADDVSVNGYMIDPFYSTSVLPGKSKFSSMSFSKSRFEENGIEQVEEIELTLRVHDWDDWMAEDYVKEVFTLRP